MKLTPTESAVRLAAAVERGARMKVVWKDEGSEGQTTIVDLDLEAKYATEHGDAFGFPYFEPPPDFIVYESWTSRAKARKLAVALNAGYSDV